MLAPRRSAESPIPGLECLHGLPCRFLGAFLRAFSLRPFAISLALGLLKKILESRREGIQEERVPLKGLSPSLPLYIDEGRGNSARPLILSHRAEGLQIFVGLPPRNLLRSQILKQEAGAPIA